MTSLPDGIVLAVDQGTGSTKGIALDPSGRVVAEATVPIGQSHPSPGRVEQDPLEIASSVETVISSLYQSVGRPVIGIGLSTQRESALAWDTASGRPVSSVIGWQDRRTADQAKILRASADADTIRARSGLPVDPMFSALKFQWILDDIDPMRERARSGRITLGTVDAWLLSRLTGERRVEIGNASRTQLLSYRDGSWDDELLAVFGVPRNALPRVSDSDAPSGAVTAVDVGGARITGVLGDSHAALFGHGVREPGAVKVTYGTGSSVMGLSSGGSDPGVVDTVAWSVNGERAVAIEGNILATGATLVWLASVLGVSTAELAVMAESSSTAGLNLVPAFAGLAAPWWDEQAVSVLAGFTLGTTRDEIARAAMESIVQQIEDVLCSAEAAAGTPIRRIHVDGGPSANDWMMHLQADLSGRLVRRPRMANLSALGAAWLAGASQGVWSTTSAPWDHGVDEFRPSAAAGETRAARRAQWLSAVSRSRAAATVTPIRDNPTEETRR